jgi:hypothetical protein
VGLHQCPSERKGEGAPVRRLRVPSHVPSQPQTGGAFRLWPQGSLLRQTGCWREPDSNPRSPARERGVRSKQLPCYGEPEKPDPGLKPAGNLANVRLRDSGMIGRSGTVGMRTTWENWSGNLRHKPPTDGDGYYFTPTTLDELKAVLTAAKALGATVRASGQRHSQPPLVVDDNRNNPPAKPDTLVVDMSCYIDIGESGIELNPGANQITVNPGVREDLVDAFLTRNNLMFRTVTAGGFFSIGGMTAVDVHGATLDAPIFAETVSAFTIVGAEQRR